MFREDLDKLKRRVNSTMNRVARKTPSKQNGNDVPPALKKDEDELKIDLKNMVDFSN